MCCQERPRDAVHEHAKREKREFGQPIMPLAHVCLLVIIETCQDGALAA